MSIVVHTLSNSYMFFLISDVVCHACTFYIVKQMQLMI